jgi:hypothetical protein
LKSFRHAVSLAGLGVCLPNMPAFLNYPIAILFEILKYIAYHQFGETNLLRNLKPPFLRAFLPWAKVFAYFPLFLLVFGYLFMDWQEKIFCFL